MGLGKTLAMLMAIASSKQTAEIHRETFFQDQRRLVPSKGTLVVVTSRRKLSGSSSLQCRILTCKLASEVFEVWRTEIEEYIDHAKQEIKNAWIAH